MKNVFEKKTVMIAVVVMLMMLAMLRMSVSTVSAPTLLPTPIPVLGESLETMPEGYVFVEWIQEGSSYVAEDEEGNQYKIDYVEYEDGTSSSSIMLLRK